PNANLIRKQTLRKLEQYSVDSQQCLAPEIRADRERERRRHAARFQDFVACLFEQCAERFESKKAPVPDAQDAFSAVVELAKRKHDSRDEESDVRRSDDHLRPAQG